MTELKQDQGMNGPAISLQDLAKTFPAGNAFRTLVGSSSLEGKEALRGVSLEVAAGECLALLGPNGAGKTTLLEILSTLLLPTSGQARIAGHEVVKEAAAVRRVLGYCPSGSDNFYPRLTGASNLEFFAVLNDLSPQQARARARQVLELVGIDGAAGVAFQRYSDGMKQRLALGRALVAEPKVLLLDEPTRGLDPVFQGEIRKFLRRTLVEKMGKTVLLVTHSLAEAEEVAGRLAILHEGRVVAAGTPAEIRHEFGEADLAAAFERAVGAGTWQ